MKKLVKGILEFRENLLQDYRERFSHLALGQSPDALFIGCSDSRVMPNLFASTNPGDLFVIRNVGNLIPPFSEYENNHAEAAAIEFSMTQLPVKNIIVCGHSECGAMQAVVAGLEKVNTQGLKAWLQHCDCSHEKTNDQNKLSGDLSAHNRLSQLNVFRQIEHLKTYPIVQEKIKANTLHLHGWYFDIATGDVYAFDEAFGRFVLIDEAEGYRILSDIDEVR